MVLEGGRPVAVQLRGAKARAADRGARVNVTDRAHRYRAQKSPPAGKKRCAFCGSRRNVEIGHVDGHEEHGTPDNLIWTCRSCNVIVGNVLRRYGLGRLTHQYNPAARGGEKRRRAGMKAYGDAIKVMRGTFEGDVGAAVRTIKASPQSIRSAYTARSWPVRRQIYGPSGRQRSLFEEAVPF